jgi:hypothetical protein
MLTQMEKLQDQLWTFSWNKHGKAEEPLPVCTDDEAKQDPVKPEEKSSVSVRDCPHHISCAIKNRHPLQFLKRMHHGTFRTLAYPHHCLAKQWPFASHLLSSAPTYLPYIFGTTV